MAWQRTVVPDARGRYPGNAPARFASRPHPVRRSAAVRQAGRLLVPLKRSRAQRQRLFREKGSRGAALVPAGLRGTLPVLRVARELMQTPPDE